MTVSYVHIDRYHGYTMRTAYWTRPIIRYYNFTAKLNNMFSTYLFISWWTNNNYSSYVLTILPQYCLNNNNNNNNNNKIYTVIGTLYEIKSSKLLTGIWQIPFILAARNTPLSCLVTHIIIPGISQCITVHNSYLVNDYDAKFEDLVNKPKAPREHQLVIIIVIIQ